MAEFTVVLEEGAVRAVNVVGTGVLASRSEDGSVCAKANACTHVGGLLDEYERDEDMDVRP